MLFKKPDMVGVGLWGVVERKEGSIFGDREFKQKLELREELPLRESINDDLRLNIS